MKKAFLISLKVFKYLFIIFSLIYWIGVVIDDWALIEKYFHTNSLQYLGIWMVWFLIFALAFSLAFWSLAALIILIQFKFIKPRKGN